MRILHIHPAMNQGGIEAMITALANEMSQQGEDVSVCSIFQPLPQAMFWERLHSSIHRFDLGKSNTGFSLKEIYKIYNFIRKGNFDVVNIHGFFYYYILTVLFLHKKIKFFYTVHSDAAMENSRWDKRLLALKKMCFRHGWIKPITISPNSQVAFYELYKCASNLIPNGVKKPDVTDCGNLIEQYRISDRTKVLVHPGRITAAKNQVVLVKVFDSLIKEGYDIVLLIAGSNDDEKIFHEIEPYFSNRIRYLGIRKDVPALLSNADAFCLPSIWEGLPVTLLEAISVGCIPICSPVGGIVNVINDGDNGLLAASSSEEDYRNVMHRYLSMSTEQIRHMKAACIDSFAKYDITNTATKYLEAYRDGSKRNNSNL